jgi:ABC-2 type transport system permease protein
LIASLRAELVKVLRPRVLIVTAVTTAVFAVGSAAIVLLSADPAGARPSDRGVTVASLSEAGGGTEVFTTTVSFAGTFLFVVFVGVVAVEFSRGTFRTMLLYQPRRLRLLAGKMSALLVFAAAVLAAAEALTWVVAKLLAPSQAVATGTWVSASALGDALADYGSVLFWVCGYALLGMTVAVLVRSVPIALAIGIAWAGRSSTCCKTPGTRRSGSSRDCSSRRSSPAAHPKSAPPGRSSRPPPTSCSVPPSRQPPSPGATSRHEPGLSADSRAAMVPSRPWLPCNVEGGRT